MDRIARVTGRDSITVLVTDTGLGGLSVAADIERRARTTGAFRSLRIIFANALPEARRGYNTMASVADKVRVFDDALAGMIRCYRPDLVLVACNTLSVLIPRTRSAQGVPVLGIVELGVAALEERLRANDDSTAIIFATETTVEAGVHRAMLVDRGLGAERIVQQACPLLAREIENDAASDIVASSIERFAAEAMAQVVRKGDAIIAGLCCTHYGYCAAQFLAALRPLARGTVEMVDPNLRMSRALFPPGRKPATGGSSEVSIRVVSRALIHDFEVRSIAALIEPVSTSAAAALRGYERNRELFPFDESSLEPSHAPQVG
jgi:glutamate racemase